MNRNLYTGSIRISFICKVFVAILITVVFEGAIRKWVSPSLTIPLILFRDCMAAYGVFWAIKTGQLKFSKLPSQILLCWTCVFVIWGLLQLIVNQTSIFLFAIGIRFWLLYLWFAYAAAISFTQEDFKIITKVIFLLVLIEVPLAVSQHYLPPSSFLNKQLDSDEEGIFLVTVGIVRTTGTFSFTAGYSIFLAFASPYFFAYLNDKVSFLKKWVSYILFSTICVGTVVSGSRGAIIFFLALYIVYIVVSVFNTKIRKLNLLLLIGFSTLLIILAPVLFSRALDATRERFDTASQAESLSERIQSTFLGESGTYGSFSVLGYGVGVGSNFAGVVKGTQFLLGETEASRTLLEGGILGLAFIALKILVVLIGLWKSLYVMKSNGNCLPLMLWVTVGVGLFSWPIISQLTINALGYLLLGLAIASLRFISK